MDSVFKKKLHLLVNRSTGNDVKSLLPVTIPAQKEITSQTD